MWFQRLVGLLSLILAMRGAIAVVTQHFEFTPSHGSPVMRDGAGAVAMGLGYIALAGFILAIVLRAALPVQAQKSAAAPGQNRNNAASFLLAAAINFVILALCAFGYGLRG